MSITQVKQANNIKWPKKIDHINIHTYIHLYITLIIRYTENELHVDRIFYYITNNLHKASHF